MRGTSLEQDPRWKDKNKKLMSQLKFPPCFSTAVSMKKVKLECMRPWVTRRITEMLGVEDDILTGTVFNHLEAETTDPRQMQVELTGFLGRHAAPFMGELWALLISAQDHGGIPKEFLDQTRQEIIAQQEALAKMQGELQKRIEGTPAVPLPVQVHPPASLEPPPPPPPPPEEPPASSASSHPPHLPSESKKDSENVSTKRARSRSRSGSRTRHRKERPRTTGWGCIEETSRPKERSASPPRETERRREKPKERSASPAREHERRREKPKEGTSSSSSAHDSGKVHRKDSGGADPSAREQELRKRALETMKDRR
eukprot:RCo012010